MPSDRTSGHHTWLLPVLVVVLILLAGCAQTKLAPAPQAQRVPGKELAAVAQTAGVRMVVEAGAWSGHPDNLAQELTPLRVTIDNGSDQPLRVRYEDFAIETGKGVRYTPLPPLRIQGTVIEQADRPVRFPRYAVTPRFAYSGFYLAPWYSPYYPNLRAWSHPWAFSPFYYDTYYPRWTVKLPTPDMLEMAIPEGVIEPGGRVSGFLYFPDIAARVERVTFSAELMQGREGQRLGALEVPFVVR